jgi:myo-inositol-1-phosphate synthase
MSEKIGVMLIGVNGALATTLFAAQATKQIHPEFQFSAPSESDPDYASLDLINHSQICYAGWDVVTHLPSESCAVHNIVPKHIIQSIAPEIDKIPIYPAVLVEHGTAIDKIISSTESSQRNKDPRYSTAVFSERPLRELVQSLAYDLQDFNEKTGAREIIVVNVASIEPPRSLTEVHKSLRSFEKGLDGNHPDISTGMIYAYAAISSGYSYINFTPSPTCELPALVELAEHKGAALAGKDGKTGQTLYKTVIAPMLKHRGLKLTGWYSTNILGNRDGEVLNDPRHLASKIESKASVLKSIMGYEDFDHQVHIHYYPPRGDSKEAWDNIDFSGWFDTKMQMKIDWLGEDSILAAPLVYDLIRWTDFFSRNGENGVLPQLASYFKSPLGTDECDFFKQIEMLKNHLKSNKYI